MRWGFGDWTLAGVGAAVLGGGAYLYARRPAQPANTTTSTSQPGPSYTSPGPGQSRIPGLPAGLPAHPTANQRITLNGQCWQYMPAVAPLSATSLARIRTDWQANISAALARGMSPALAYQTYGTSAQVAAAQAQLGAGTPAGWQHCTEPVPA